MKYIHILTALFLLALAGCVKQEFDEPPLGGEPVDLTANATIAQVKALHTPGNIETITEDWIIEGEVIMDDRSGNYYKSLVIQDATGGIEVSFNDGFLYTEYPVGRKIYIKVKDLMLSDYNGLTQLIGSTLVEGTNVDEIGITLAQRKNVIFKGAIATDKLAPAVKSVNAIGASDVSTIVRFEGVEFFNPNQTYADPVAKLTRNRFIEDCNGNQIILRTSGYSDFAGVELASGNGSITGVLSVFGTTYQLYIRDLDDVQMDDVRCDGGGGGTGNADLIDISVLRSQFTGSATNAPADKKIKGIVVSDLAGANINVQNMVFQDGTAGILVRFQDAHSFQMGDEVEVNISGAELSEFNGLLQVNNVQLSSASKTGTGTANVRTATISEINANAETWESTVVKVVGAELSGGGTFSGNITVDDGSGSIGMYTAFSAVFAEDALPSGAVDVLALIGDFNGAQLNMRNRNDVTGGTTGTGGNGDPVETINQDFQSQSDNVAVGLTDWTNTATVGTRTWLAKEFSGNVYAQATSYQSTDPAEEMWLITPPIILTQQKTLTFESAQAFYDHDGLTVWVSTDFDGTNIASATWEQLSADLAGASTPNHEFVSSGDIALPIAPQGYVAFKYNGNSVSGTTNYRIDNVIVE